MPPDRGVLFQLHSVPSIAGKSPFHSLATGLVLCGLTMLLPGRAHDSKDGEDDHSCDMANLVP
jgi:hypothetical protein